MEHADWNNRFGYSAVVHYRPQKRDPLSTTTTAVALKRLHAFKVFMVWCELQVEAAVPSQRRDRISTPLKDGLEHVRRYRR